MNIQFKYEIWEQNQLVDIKIDQKKLIKIWINYINIKIIYIVDQIEEIKQKIICIYNLYQITYDNVKLEIPKY